MLGLSYKSTPYHVRDTAITGLFIAINKTCKSYKVQRDLWTGPRGARRLVKTVRYFLGNSPEMTLDDARTLALEVIAKIKRGEDPRAPDPAEAAHSWTVEKMYAEYADDMRTRECQPRSIQSTADRLDFYLSDWKRLPITEITRSVARAEHVRITKEHGKRVANMALRDFRAAYNLALRVVDEPDKLPDNPTKSITWNKERPTDRVIMQEDLAEWWQKVEALPNPLRKEMHKLGLLSGLRPGALMSLKREWIKLDKRCISIPRMKSGRAFDLPLSAPMVACVQRAIKVGDMLYPNSVWLFPSRDRKGQIIHVQVVREEKLPSDTGHILRHTYRTLAKSIGVDQIDARLLLDHKVPGIDGVYIHSQALFGRLLKTQERLSKSILSLCEHDVAEVAAKRKR